MERWREHVYREVVNFCNTNGSRTFSLQEFLAAKQAVFEEYRPNNKHVDAKIRQQLQELRDGGRLAFLDNSGHYTLRGDGFLLLDSEKEEIKTLDISKESPEKREYLVETYVRNTAWARKARERFGDRCLCPDCANTFFREDGTRYIEVHHIIPLHMGGEDGLWNLSVLCAHHHRMAHYGDIATRRNLEQSLRETTQKIVGVIL